MITGANNDKLIRAYSLLTALRQNTSGDSIDEYTGLTTSHVNQFHTILSSISSLGIDVSVFLIPEQEIKPRVISISSQGTSYSEEEYVRKSIFLTGLDGFIKYLHILLKGPERKTDFHPQS
ncbi:hypothetical protein ACFLUU_08195 [Chloroflexota bacterium]